MAFSKNKEKENFDTNKSRDNDDDAFILFRGRYQIYLAKTKISQNIRKRSKAIKDLPGEIESSNCQTP